MIRAREGAGKRARGEAQPITRNTTTAATARTSTAAATSSAPRPRVPRASRGRTAAASGASVDRAGTAVRVTRIAWSARGR
ncbi:hypothetical protein D8Y23_08115 [Microbacterium enclense]|uniref:Uncharacterized protein n=1 Tax=Microbacterium enclense TaxID=993073 RepID=A0A3S3MD32_9MICO|nr:hypothetical protein D8Y23_08115 [Microbacterium enclense]